MENTCGTCRFNVGNHCTMYPINVQENLKSCVNYAEKCIVNESQDSQKIQLND